METMKSDKVKLGIMLILLVSYYVILNYFVASPFLEVFVYEAINLLFFSEIIKTIFYASIALYISTFPARQLYYSIKNNRPGYFWTGIGLLTLEIIGLLMRYRLYWFDWLVNSTADNYVIILDKIVMVLVGLAIVFALLFVYQRYIVKMHLNKE